MTDNRRNDHEAGGVEHALNKATDAVGGMTGKAGASMTTKAPDFVEKAAISDQYEIAAAEVALERSRTQPIRDVAQSMIDDHRMNSEKLKAAAGRSQKVDTGNFPQGLDSRRSKMVEHLREAPADKFDETYVDQQKLAHEEAVSLMHNYRDDGDCPELRGFAAEASTVVEGHLDRVTRLQKEYS
jgi:putative membrane protein